MSIRRLLISVGALALLFAAVPRAYAAATAITFDPPFSGSFVQGTGGTLDVTTNFSGATPPTLASSPVSADAGKVTFADNHDGTGVFTVDASAAPGVFSFNVTATATDTTADSDASHTYTITVRSLVITSISPSSSTFTVGQPGTVTIATSGFTKTPKITESGALPSGVTFTDLGNGTARIAGTPAAGTAKSYPLTVTATHDSTTSDPDATTNFTLTVLNPSTSTGGATCVTLNSSQAIARSFKRGERFFVRGTMPAGVTHVNLLWNGGSPTVGSDGVNSNGSYLVSAMIPSAARLGANTVVARGLNASGAVLGSATCGLNVVSGGVSGTATLPRTGLPTSALIAIGVTMVELGAGLLLYTDRRRAQPVIGPWLQRTIERLDR